MILKEKTNITKMEMLDIIIDERYFQREGEWKRKTGDTKRRKLVFLCSEELKNSAKTGLEVRKLKF